MVAKFGWVGGNYDSDEKPSANRGRRITAERSASRVESVLNISEARLEDSGKYSCVARNDITTDAHSAGVDIEGASFVRPLRNVTVVSGSLLTLRCPYGGYPIEPLL
ncbi:hypothetical protein MTO96_038963 [Rhipicephalus appendiculatus]